MTTKLPLVLRETKKSPLTSQELDSNFSVIDKAIGNLQDTIEDTDQWNHIEWIGNNTLVFHKKNGRTLSVIVPLDFLIFQGPWQSQKSYIKGDMVNIFGGLFLCQSSHKSTQAFEKDFWAPMIPPKTEEGNLKQAKNPYEEQDMDQDLNLKNQEKNPHAYPETFVLPLRTTATLHTPNTQTGAIALLTQHKRSEPMYYDGTYWRFFSDHAVVE
jgi:hypothetical protein